MKKKNISSFNEDISLSLKCNSARNRLFLLPQIWRLSLLWVFVDWYIISSSLWSYLGKLYLPLLRNRPTWSWLGLGIFCLKKLWLRSSSMPLKCYSVRNYASRVLCARIMLVENSIPIQKSRAKNTWTLLYKGAIEACIFICENDFSCFCSNQLSSIMVCSTAVAGSPCRKMVFFVTGRKSFVSVRYIGRCLTQLPEKITSNSCFTLRCTVERDKWLKRTQITFSGTAEKITKTFIFILKEMSQDLSLKTCFKLQLKEPTFIFSTTSPGNAKSLPFIVIKPFNYIPHWRFFGLSNVNIWYVL